MEAADAWQLARRLEYPSIRVLYVANSSPPFRSARSAAVLRRPPADLRRTRLLLRHPRRGALQHKSTGRPGSGIRVDHAHDFDRLPVLLLRVHAAADQGAEIPPGSRRPERDFDERHAGPGVDRRNEMSGSSGTALRVGVIGFGKMGLLHGAIVNGLSGSRLVAVADNTPGLVDLLGRVLPDVARYDDFDRMLSSEALDAVFITS